MTPIADMVEQLAAAGVSIEAIIMAIRGAEEHAALRTSVPRELSIAAAPMSNAERQARYRDRQRNKNNVAERNAVTEKVTERNVTRNASSSLPFLLPSSEDSLEKERMRDENARARGNSAEFDEFWQVFPNKVGKQAARQAFDRAQRNRSVTHNVMMEALRRYVTKTDDRPWCNPTTWLNQGRWDDQPAQTVSGKTANGTSQIQPEKSALAACRELGRQLAGNVDNQQDRVIAFGLPQGRLRGPDEVRGPSGDRAGTVPK